MKLITGSHEYWIALEAIGRAAGMRLRNDFRVGDFFIWSAGRIFLADWARRDIADPEYYRGRSTSGWRDGDHGTDDDRLRRKWSDRAGLYVDEHNQALRDIGDWLYSAARGRLPWLLNLDDQGRPKKLMKCSTIEQLHGEARKWHRTAAQQVEPLTHDIGADDEIDVYDLGVGYKLVRLLSPSALDRESETMKHCIGYGFYDSKLAMPHRWRYYSVRNPAGVPVATLETQYDRPSDAWVILQFQGPGNRLPEAHIHHLIAGACADMDLIWREEVADRLPPILPGRRLT